MSMSSSSTFTRPSADEVSRVRTALETFQAEKKSLSDVLGLANEFGVYVIPEDLVFNVPGFRLQKTTDGKFIEVPASLLNLTSLAELIVERRHRRRDTLNYRSESAYP